VTRPTADRPAPGVRRTRTGWQAFVRVLGPGGESVFRSKRFPAETPLAKMKLWISEQKSRAFLRLPAVDPPVGTAGGPTLQQSVDDYLKAVDSMTTRDEREAQLQQWVDALGAHTPRAAITSATIRSVIERWKAQGYTVNRRVETTNDAGETTVSHRKDKRAFSETTLNHRRTALMALWTVLDGKSAPNPVRDVPRLSPDVQPLDLPSIEDATRVIASINRDERTKYREDAKERRDGRKTRARLLVMLWTGWPPAQIQKLEAARLAREIKAGNEVTVTRRRKGRGTKTEVLPLLPQAVSALKEFDAAEAYGDFSTSAVYKSVQTACDRLGVRRFRPYDLRHLFLTTIAELTGDPIAVNFLGLHTTMKQTERYIERAKRTRAKAAVVAAGKLLQVPKKTARSRRIQ
jgi:integrase